MFSTCVSCYEAPTSRQHEVSNRDKSSHHGNRFRRRIVAVKNIVAAAFLPQCPGYTVCLTRESVATGFTTSPAARSNTCFIAELRRDAAATLRARILMEADQGVFGDSLELVDV